jgi:hypothetical protein
MMYGELDVKFHALFTTAQDIGQWAATCPSCWKICPFSGKASGHFYKREKLQSLSIDAESHRGLGNGLSVRSW